MLLLSGGPGWFAAVSALTARTRGVLYRSRPRPIRQDLACLRCSVGSPGGRVRSALVGASGHCKLAAESAVETLSKYASIILAPPSTEIVRDRPSWLYEVS
jgi:hypothetical protein